MKLKYKFYVSAAIFLAAVATTLPYLAKVAGSLAVYGIPFVFFLAPAALLFIRKMRALHTADAEMTQTGGVLA